MPSQNILSLLSSKTHSMAVLDLMGDEVAKEAALKQALIAKTSHMMHENDNVKTR